MKNVLLGALGALLLAVAIGAAVIYGGFVDVAADTPHHPVVYETIELAREKAIARAASGIVAPANLADAERVRRGAGNYDAMCADCHLSPGVDNSEIRRGLYPTPPDLSRRQPNSDASPTRQFWIIKHGIKATGMPAWSKGGMEDQAIWDLVAFLGRLPTLEASQYRALVAASDGHSHGGAVQDRKKSDGHAGHNHAH